MNGASDYAESVPPYEIDLRSDTVSRPTDAMRDAMKNALVGDDVYGEDPTVNQLEQRVARMFGKEKALFVPSGTMANLIAVMVHCDKRGCEAICGDKAHTFLFEQGGVSQLAGVLLTIIKNKVDGTFDLDDFKQMIRINPDYHEPYTKLCIIENTHNMCGGKVLPLSWVKNLSSICRAHNIALHMDGARIFNAAIASGKDVKELVQDCDSVCFCLSKSLGAPIGSLLVGSEDFITKARRARKVLGGGMRQVGLIAAAGIVALDQMINRLSEDHARTYAIAKAIFDAKSPLFTVDLSSVQTNIFMVYLKKGVIKASELIARLKRVTDEERNEGINVIIKLGSRCEDWVRFTLYYEITDNDVKLTIQKVLFVIKEFEKMYPHSSS